MADLSSTIISDIVVPSHFTPYVQQLTEQKSNLIKSGAVVRDPLLDQFLGGGGITTNIPSFKDLARTADRVSDDQDTVASAGKIGSATEIQVRLSRNQSWGAADLAGDLAGEDPLMAIASRVADYRASMLQSAFVNTVKGVFADNAAAPDASEHVANDMTWDVSGSSFSKGITDFTTESFIDAAFTMGDSFTSLKTLFVHSIVFAGMRKNDLIDFVPDSTGTLQMPFFQDMRVIVDDEMPYNTSTKVAESWIFGDGAVRLGFGNPKTPTEVYRDPRSGNGGGSEELFSRWEWCIAPSGVAYVGTATKGGPSNATLATASSWKRVFAERKQIKIARLITRQA
jgi:hypothetical protein